jgi:hypothetical protein
VSGGPGIGGPGPLYTAAHVLAPSVATSLAHEWGEALWTATDLAHREFNEQLRAASLRGILGIGASSRPLPRVS